MSLLLSYYISRLRVGGVWKTLVSKRRSPVFSNKKWFKSVIRMALFVLIGATVTGTEKGLGQQPSPSSRRVPGPDPGQPETSPQVRLLIPAYFYPGGDGLVVWQKLLETAKSVEPGLLIAIVNPASGPGTVVDPNYVEVMRQARAAQITLIGYVTLSYAKRPAAEVRAEVDRWLQLYPSLQGIFFDEQPSGAASLAMVQDCLAHARRKLPKGIFVTNPGTVCAAEYLQGPRPPTVCLFEHHEGFERYSLPDWGKNVSPANLAVLLYQVPDADTMKQKLRRAIGLRTGVVYVTDRTGVNPWDGLPQYWAEEVRFIRDGNRRGWNTP